MRNIRNACVELTKWQISVFGLDSSVVPGIGVLFMSESMYHRHTK